MGIALTFNSGEFSKIKLKVVEGVPNAEEKDGVLVDLRVLDADRSVGGFRFHSATLSCQKVFEPQMTQIGADRELQKDICVPLRNLRFLFLRLHASVQLFRL